MNKDSSISERRCFSLWLYILIVFGLSWPFQIVSAIWATDLLQLYILNGTSMCMVTVGTFIAGRYVFKDGFAGAGWKWGKARQHLTVVALVLLLWAVPTLVDVGVGTLTLPTDLGVTQIVWIFVLLFVTLIPAFGEEFGWRGYMLPHLLGRHSIRKAVLIHAVIWCDSIQTTIGLGPVAGVWAVVLLCTLGIVLLWKGKWENLEPENGLIEAPETESV